MDGARLAIAVKNERRLDDVEVWRFCVHRYSLGVRECKIRSTTAADATWGGLGPATGGYGRCKGVQQKLVQELKLAESAHAC